MNSIEKRLSAVRALMVESGYDALIVPRADEYLGEYIPPHNERLLWISHFTGSAGVVIVLRDKAAIFVDGRYTVQVRQQVPGELFEFHHLVDEPHAQWLSEQLPAGAKIAYDPRMHPLQWHSATETILAKNAQLLVPETNNLIDRCWSDRPTARIDPALLLDEAFTGESSSSKRARIAKELVAKGAQAALIFAPDSVSWLLNIRGTDVPMLPLVQSFAMLAEDGSVSLFIDPGRVPAGLEEHVGEGLKVYPESEAQSILSNYQGKNVLADPATANAWTQLALQRGGATLIGEPDPVALPKACKNTVEVEGSRRAHIRDAVAEVKFLCWLDGEVNAGALHDEAVLADKLLSFREVGERFRGLSFDTISAAGGNAAMCHYNHQDGEPATLEMNSVYLLDSGAQYTDGTTDITRTIAIGDPGDDIRGMYTRVLKGHIALDGARFPKGTTGSQLDVLARQFLWSDGFDYDHGTGHGVGSFLSVHEGPQSISKRAGGADLRVGMILSNEPGYYRDGCFGIRCENLLVVQALEDSAGETPMMEFDVLTMVPFDNRLLDVSMLTPAEVTWVDAYHARVNTVLNPLLQGAEKDWMQRATSPLVA
ncbi:MAG: aminopeptidase P family protein [Proteobacteria bacterium]|nr:aminopeptidase P family protein [Pseudomonadota bacterium]